IYGLLLILIAIRYGVYMAALGISWIGLLTFILPTIPANRPGLSIANESVFITANLDILLLCAITLLTGRAVSDLFAEIADRKKSEESLRSAEIKYRTLAENIPPIIYTADIDQHVGVTYISPQITSLGFTQEEWIADPELWLRQIHPNDREEVMEKIKQVRENGNPFKSEYRLITRSGDARWFLDEAMNVLDNHGKVLFRHGYMLDITARKDAEEALTAREHYLELLNEMTRTILLTSDLDSALGELARNMVKLTNADDCHITRWDNKKEMVIPAETVIANPEKLSLPAMNDPKILMMTASVLKAEHVLAVDDVFNSPYMNSETAKNYPVRSALGIPLIVRDYKLGAVIITYNTAHHFTQQEIELSEHAAKHIAVALWNAQRDIELNKRLQESAALAKISLLLSETERVSHVNVLQLIVDSAKELIPGAEQAVIHLLDKEKQFLIPEALAGYNNFEEGKKKMRLGEGVAGQAIESGEVLNIEDVFNDSRFIKLNPNSMVRSLIVVPVMSGSEKLGTISVQSNTPNTFTQYESLLLRELGLQAAIAIENARLMESTQQALKETNALYRINQGMVALNTDELLADVVDLLQQNFGYYHVQVYVIDPDTGDFVLRAGSGEIGRQLKTQNVRLPAGAGIIGYAAETFAPFFTNNVDEVMFFIRHELLPETKSELAMPVKIGDQLLGILDIQQAPPGIFTNRDLQLVSAVADQLAVALQKADLYEDLQTSLQHEKKARTQLVQNERLAVMGRLLASVSHELNNPLQAIQNALFLLKGEQELSTQGKQDLEIVLSETDRMAAMIQRLRATYRPTHAEDFTPVQINNIVEDVYALISTHLRHNNISFEFYPDPALPVIPGLADQIRQVLLNLFMNGVEAMKASGRLGVSTKYLKEDGEIFLSISDNGTGISPSILPNIFDAFITNKETGTGLGLTISYDIILKHQGRIVAENNPESGATFKIWLPTKRMESS
ncbi:MAG: GAF domain-containing protein, partial [Anaerolineales bacterium]|nr:GAF domain-containing protein [Anaerolineales bacterium]